MLIKIGLTQPLCINEENNQAPVKYAIVFCESKRHISPTNHTDGINMSPVEM